MPYSRKHPSWKSEDYTTLQVRTQFFGVRGGRDKACLVSTSHSSLLTFHLKGEGTLDAVFQKASELEK